MWIKDGKIISDDYARQGLMALIELIGERSSHVIIPVQTTVTIYINPTHTHVVAILCPNTSRFFLQLGYLSLFCFYCIPELPNIHLA